MAYYFFYLSFMLAFINLAIQQRYDVIEVIEVPRPNNNFHYQKPQGNPYVVPNQYPSRYPVFQNNQPNYNYPINQPRKNEYTIYAIEVPTNVLFGKNNINPINPESITTITNTLPTMTTLSTTTANATKEKKKKSRRRKKPKPKTTTEANNLDTDNKDDNEYEYYDIDIRSFNNKKTPTNKEVDNDKLPIWTT